MTAQIPLPIIIHIEHSQKSATSTLLRALAMRHHANDFFSMPIPLKGGTEYSVRR